MMLSWSYPETLDIKQLELTQKLLQKSPDATWDLTLNPSMYALLHTDSVFSTRLRLLTNHED